MKRVRRFQNGSSSNYVNMACKPFPVFHAIFTQYLKKSQKAVGEALITSFSYAKTADCTSAAIFIISPNEKTGRFYSAGKLLFGAFLMPC